MNRLQALSKTIETEQKEARPRPRTGWFASFVTRLRIRRMHQRPTAPDERQAASDG